VRGRGLALALLLAGCAGSGSWTKPGADAAATLRESQDCRAMAASAVKTDADIDQDILATRLDDRQRGSLFRLQSDAMQQHTTDRAAAIVSSCMRAKGFTQSR
jgi:hypothetical protein